MRERRSPDFVSLHPGHVLTVFFALAILVATAAFGLTARTHVPPAAIGIANSFIDRINFGDLSEAYSLTRRDAAVGESLGDFDAKLRRQLAIDAFPLHRSVTFVGIRNGGQSYGNRIRRWLSGSKVDPDVVDLDYMFGLPFEIRLASDARGTWRVVFFQSHAS